MRSDSVLIAIARFEALRGSGPYDQPTMTEAAMLIEEFAGLTLSDEQLSETNLGDSGRLERFALTLLPD